MAGDVDARAGGVARARWAASGLMRRELCPGIFGGTGDLAWRWCRYSRGCGGSGGCKGDARARRRVRCWTRRVRRTRRTRGRTGHWTKYRRRG